MTFNNRTLRCVAASILMFASSLPVVAESTPKASASAATRAAIEEANRRFSAAFEQGNFAGLAGMYTADAVVLPPDSEMVQGSAAIEALWKAVHVAGVLSAELSTVDLGEAGETAYEVGRALLTIQPEGKERMTVPVKYLVVWQRQADGAWKLHRDIWNAMPSLP